METSVTDSSFVITEVYPESWVVQKVLFCTLVIGLESNACEVKQFKLTLIESHVSIITKKHSIGLRSTIHHW